MDSDFNHTIIDEFKSLYDEGYRCINYEANEKDNLFTVYLKNFEKENISTLECDTGEGAVLKNYIDELSQQKPI